MQPVARPRVRARPNRNQHGGERNRIRSRLDKNDVALAAEAEPMRRIVYAVEKGWILVAPKHDPHSPASVLWWR